MGKSIGNIDRDIEVSDEKINEFKNNEKKYCAIKNKKIILNLKAYVSKKA